MLKLTIENLSLKFAETSIFCNINLSCEAGNIIIIKGKNGSGKTSFLQSICSVIPLHIKGELCGKITLHKNEHNINIFPAEDTPMIYPEHFGYLMQESDKQLCFPYIEEELFFGAENMKRDYESCLDNYDVLIDMFPFLQENEQETSTLSFGQKKILLFSALILKNPDIYLLDEPSAGLSNDFRENFASLILALKNKGKIIILAEHDPFFDEYADEVVSL